jgi:protein involved in polysaccharide export with SLBB domain
MKGIYRLLTNNNSWMTICLVILMGVCQTTGFSQSLSMEDVSTLNVDELSDEQISELVRRANQSGISEIDLIKMAQARGLPAVQVQKLQNRIENLTFSKARVEKSSPSKRTDREQKSWEEITKGMVQFNQLVDGNAYIDNEIFGSDLFYNPTRKLTFEPNFNLPTPKNYILGAGDVLYVDIYGQSEQYNEATISSDGKIILENIGPISVSGKSIEEATLIIKNRLSAFYSGMKGASPSTFLQVTLGNVRTIKVHLTGEIRLPGTFTLSAFSSVFNALYAAGGPSDQGTMRSIKVIRNNKLLAEVDVYSFLMEGKNQMDFQLQDQDVIMVEPYLNRVKISGEVKRPKTFEIKPNETLDQLLTYAGGLTDQGLKDRISVTRIIGKERAVSDVYQNQLSIFEVKGGDEYVVHKVLNRFTNRIQIKGAVFREGNYALIEGLTLSALIEMADGLKGDAYLPRASILRTYSDFSTEVIPVDLKGILNKTKPDIKLEREDIVRIASIYDLKEEYYVKISGEIRTPGAYPFSKNMSVEDLIIMSGGLLESANLDGIEIARRSSNQQTGDFSELIDVKVNSDLTPSEVSINLEPYDHLIVRKKSNFTLEKLIRVEGQVNSPGAFAVTNAEERISSVIQRAGGLTPYAYPKGATLIRKTEFFEKESDQAKKQKQLQSLQQTLLKGGQNTESNDMLVERLLREINSLNGIDNNYPAADISAKKEALIEITQNLPGVGSLPLKESEAVAIDLEAILNNPGSSFDLILEEGDVINIPRQLQTIRLRGHVVYPTTVRHEPLKTMPYYINRAGGFEVRANRKRTYVVYANGEVARSRSFLGIRSYPSLEPGAEVIVPTKGPRIPLRPGEIISFTTGLATLGLIAAQIFNK